jgi:DNA-binding NarL/FixJ family response regulator
LYTDVKDQAMVAEALRHRIQGYVLKRSPPEQLLAATRTVAAGGSYLDPAISTLVLAELNSSAESPHRPVLSQRERTILGALAEGKPNKEIAKQLFITERTVKFHVSSVMRHLGARNRTHAVIIAEQLGLLRSKPDSRHGPSAVTVKLLPAGVKV